VSHHQYALRRLVGGVAWIGASGVCGRIIAFTASIVLAHTLGAAAFGVLAFGLSVAVIFSACASLGLDELLVRETVRHPNRSGAIFADALILRLAAIPVGVGGALLLAIGYRLDAWLGVTLAGYAILNSCLLSACAVFRGRGRMNVQALLIGGQAVLISLLSTTVAVLTRAVDGVGGAYAVGTAAVVVVAYWLLARSGAQPRFGWRPTAWTRLAHVSAPFAVGAIGLL
jgi:O-antigen/teichoic acid export membrane protein